MTEEYQKVFKGKYGCYNDYPQNENDKILAGFSYFTWIVALIALVAIKPQSPFLRFHAIQALGLTVSIMVFSLITIVLCFLIIGLLLIPFLWALSFYPLVVMILVLVGKDHRVPWLAKYVEENFI